MAYGRSIPDCADNPDYADLTTDRRTSRSASTTGSRRRSSQSGRPRRSDIPSLPGSWRYLPADSWGCRSTGQLPCSPSSSLWPWVRTSNVLLVPRLRQEVAAHGAVEGVARAVGRTGGVTMSCRLVMACVFLIGLARNPMYLVQEFGVAVLVGVLLGIFLVRCWCLPGTPLRERW